MKTISDQFEAWLDEFRKEAELAVRTFYAHRTIHAYASESEDAHRELNRHWWFWATALYSFQCSLFIVLGRAFDSGKDTHSIHKLLRLCQDNPDLFSLPSLRQRKLESPTASEWVDNYMSGKVAPGPEVMRALKRMVADARRSARKYIDIRNTVYGHKIAFEKDQIAALFSKTQVSEMEQLVLFLEWMHKQLWELYNNGCLPEERSDIHTLEDLKVRHRHSTQKSTAQCTENDVRQLLDLLRKAQQAESTVPAKAAPSAPSTVR